MPQNRTAEWSEAQRRCRLSDEGVAMAKQLGMSPRSLIKNIPNPRERWKAPVEDWVRGLHEKRFGRRAPEASRANSERLAQASLAPEPAPDAPNELELAREELYRKLDTGELDIDALGAEESALERETPVSGGEINEQNRGLKLRYDTFRRFAGLFAQEASKLDFVQRIVLFGSVAAPLTKEVPRFRRFQRARIAVWHECNDVDLAVWVNDLTQLRALKRAVNDSTNLWQAIANQENLPGVPHHAADVFILESGTNRYRGNLCHYGQCPKGKPECEVAGCGAQPFLRLYEDFEFDRYAPCGEHAITLFDRAPGE